MEKIMPNPEHATPEELEIAKESTPDKQHYIRLYAIQMLLEGKPKREVARAFNRDRNSLTRWVKQWNEGGIDALRTIRSHGRPKLLSDVQTKELKEILQEPQKAGETHWTIVKLRGHLERLWGKEIKYTTLLAYVERLGFRQAVPRSWPDKQDEAERERFVQELAALLSDPENEVWFGDESGFIADPRPRRRWVLIGSRPRLPYTGLHIRQSVIGAVAPRGGEFEALVVPEVDAEIFQLFLDQLAKATRDRRRKVVLVLDNASWHKAKRLDWRHIQPVYLPAYSPDLNPIERLWAQVKAKFFSDWIGRSHDELTERLVTALRAFMNDKKSVAKTCAV